jgi:hypothetical protein
LHNSGNQSVKSELVIQAEKALVDAQKMRPGADRIEALKQAGKLRNAACLGDLNGPEPRSKN